ncbi:UDP-N-acetylmuramoyl-tripeptide--D-alanyl-D-alanine ligase [Chitinimonas sp. BJYL2]|uniref:UDP-N-acetylmuramoyl-tripeptide--D-alanyl-D- alanine ligase n=1 Tax=Chitinimonas sp. BJYL2 TaxID=2976696 RepID=UPI0022B3844D|nr:UDP-N-acetylmuramoyl-tripeptide--D-alanyl-D-alanine ligase [Chitinimonas sp. BJYL2]
MSAMQSLHAAALDLAAPLRAGGEAVYTRVSSDSRDIRAGDLFVAIKGDRFDGHDFVATALAQGAVGALVEAGHPRLAGLPADAPVIEVADTVAALGALAQAWRRKFSLPVVAITGSSGKTTVKDMVATVLRHAVGDDAVLATSGNLNNHLGVPLMLLRLRAAHRYAVIEMGMNHFGEIAYLSRLALPDVAMVNNAGTAHIGNLGSVAGIAQAKGEIFESLTNQGTALVNLDDDFADYWKSLNKSRRILGFGLLQGQVQARDLAAGALSSQFTLITPTGEAALTLPTPGLHNVRNALACAAVCHALGLDVAGIAAGLARFAGSKGRLQQKRASNGALVIDDSYNANPDSMHAAMDVLASQSGPRWLVLGDIGETDNIAARHAELGSYARSKGLPALYAVGESMRHAVTAFGEGGQWFDSHAALAAALQSQLTPDATVLVKGSRFMRMEQVVDALTATEQEGH